MVPACPYRRFGVALMVACPLGAQAWEGAVPVRIHNQTERTVEVVLTLPSPESYTVRIGVESAGAAGAAPVVQELKGRIEPLPMRLDGHVQLWRLQVGADEKLPLRILASPGATQTPLGFAFNARYGARKSLDIQVVFLPEVTHPDEAWTHLGSQVDRPGLRFLRDGSTLRIVAGQEEEKGGGPVADRPWASAIRELLRVASAMHAAERTWLARHRDGLRCEPHLPTKQSYEPDSLHSDRFKIALDLWALDRRLLKVGKALWELQGEGPIDPGNQRLAADLVECLELAGGYKTMLHEELQDVLPKVCATAMRQSLQASALVRRLGEDAEQTTLEASLGLHLLVQLNQRRLVVIQDLGGLGPAVQDKRAKYLRSLRSRFDLRADPVAPSTVQALLERGWAWLERPEVAVLAQSAGAPAAPPAIAAPAPVAPAVAAPAAPAPPPAQAPPEASTDPATLEARNRDAQATAEAEARAHQERLETLRRRRALRKEVQAAAQAGRKPKRPAAVAEPGSRVQAPLGPLPVVWHPQAYKDWVATKDARVQSSLSRTTDLLERGGLDYCLGHELAKSLVRHDEVYELRPHGAAKALRPLFMIDGDRILILTLATKKTFDASVDLAVQRAAATRPADFLPLGAHRERGRKA